MGGREGEPRSLISGTDPKEGKEGANEKFSPSPPKTALELGSHWQIFLSASTKCPGLNEPILSFEIPLQIGTLKRKFERGRREREASRKEESMPIAGCKSSFEVGQAAERCIACRCG